MQPSMFVAPDRRDELVFLSKVCEQAERYEEMVVCLKKVVKQSPELTAEERNLLAVAYKQVLHPRRVAWRVVASLESVEDMKGNRDTARLVGGYKRLLEKEMTDLCEDCIQVIDKALLPNVKQVDEQVFYLKLQADYYRYIAEIGPGAEAQRDAALDAYNKALELCSRHVADTSPMKLGLCLNLAVFHHEILRLPDRAAEIARGAFEAAIADLENLDEDSYKESTAIVQLIRDNLTMWDNDRQADDNSDDAG
eukprot:TRINITY_DN494_c0_g1_i1.p1 TRINITY_DN494_c0_g1~~TRINITY_DN494_c0_g1_i1.p1  ORF type:complete len:252 (+),score=117.46 TRINITY_DN494_c0_g1_i1:57-812(+)